MAKRTARVTNPLTAIWLFGSLAETTATVCLPLLDAGLQVHLLCFVMGFPVLVVVLFFLTLNFNRRAIYAPGDFDDEENFVRLLDVSCGLDSLTAELEVTKALFTQPLGADQLPLKQVQERLEDISADVEAIRRPVNEAVEGFAGPETATSDLLCRIFRFLGKRKPGVQITWVMREFRVSRRVAVDALETLRVLGLVEDVGLYKKMYALRSRLDDDVQST